MNKEELLKTYLGLVNYLLMHGEILKGLWYLQNPPAFIDSEDEVNAVLGETLEQINHIAQLQNTGTVDGKFNAGFTVPDAIDTMVAFQKLKSLVAEKGLKRLVDVGAFSGWIGKELSLDGVAVHGIDINPVVVQLAAFYAMGSLATHEYLPVQKLGATHPKQFDGAILFDVLEHVADPALALKNVKMAVKVGGWIFINLPHPQGENETRDVHTFEEHEHLCSFSKKEIEELMRKEKNFSLETITNEAKQINWFIMYQV